jgi:hypothetical protein
LSATFSIDVHTASSHFGVHCHRTGHLFAPCPIHPDGLNTRRFATWRATSSIFACDPKIAQEQRILRMGCLRLPEDAKRDDPLPRPYPTGESPIGVSRLVEPPSARTRGAPKRFLSKPRSSGCQAAPKRGNKRSALPRSMACRSALSSAFEDINCSMLRVMKPSGAAVKSVPKRI